MKSLVILFTVTCFINLNLPAQVEALYDACDKPDLPGGYAAAVIKDGKVVFQKSYGYSNFEHDIPFSSSTVFDFASVAKQFTGFAIATLVNQEKLSLDDDIRQYLPEVPDYGETVTIRHLLYHSSGIRDWVGLVKLSGRYKTDVITDEFLMNMVKHQKELNFSPGEQFQYSNTGYFLLAQIVSRVSDKSFREWTDDNIFKPLKMDNTLFLDDYTEIIKGRASSYKRGAKGSYVNNPNNLTSYGSSSLFSTIDDMVKWVLNYERRKIGSEAVWNMMLEEGVLNNGQGIKYGFGISLNEYQGIRNYGHGGSWGGSVCQLSYFPGQRFAVIFIANRDPSGVYVDSDVYRIFMSDILPDQGSDKEEKEEIAERTTVEIDPGIMEDYVGLYLQESRVIEVEKRNKNLFLHMPWEQNVKVFPESDNKFFKKDANVQYSFQRDEDGNVRQLTIHVPDGREFLYTRLNTGLSADVEKLCGEYYCDELQTPYTISIKNEQLIIEHFHNEDVSLIRMDKYHYLGDKWWFADIQFIHDDNNRITGFRLSADNGNVRNLLFTKH